MNPITMLVRKKKVFPASSMLRVRRYSHNFEFLLNYLFYIN